MQQLTRNIQAEIKQYHEACGGAAWRCGVRVCHFFARRASDGILVSWSTTDDALRNLRGRGQHSSGSCSWAPDGLRCACWPGFFCA